MGTSRYLIIAPDNRREPRMLGATSDSGVAHKAISSNQHLARKGAAAVPGTLVSHSTPSLTNITGRISCRNTIDSNITIATGKRKSLTLPRD
jgi:hypothetical protein